MSVTHPSGSDLESMNEFYDKKFLRAVTLLVHVHVASKLRHSDSASAGLVALGFDLQFGPTRASSWHTPNAGQLAVAKPLALLATLGKH